MNLESNTTALEHAGLNIGSERNADTTRNAALAMMRRARPGIAAYPTSALLIAFATPMYRDHPRLSIGIVVAMVLTALFREMISRNFDRLYRASPARWNRLFALGALSAGTLWAVQGFVAVLRYQTGWPGVLSLLISAGIASGAVIAYTPSRRLTQVLLLILGLPCIASALLLPEGGLWLVLTFTSYVVYLWLIGKKLTAEYWEAAVTRKELEISLLQQEEAMNEALVANEAKGRFLANMSHELRTPMTGVIGIADVLAQTELTEAQQRHVGMIRDSGNTLVQLLNSVLDLAKVEAGKMELREEDFDPSKLIEEVAQLFAPAAHQKDLEFVCRIARDTPKNVRSDPMRLRQIISNLVGNAVKFTNSGFVSLGISGEVQSDGRQQLHIEVEDSGIGISEKNRARIFDNFVQEDSSVTRNVGGSGLGLSISAELAKLMGGSLKVESELGVGSTLCLSLPCSAAHQSDPTTPAPRFEGWEIYLLDSHLRSSQVLEEILRAWGAEVFLLDQEQDGAWPLDLHNPKQLLLIDSSHVSEESQLPERTLQMHRFGASRKQRSEVFTLGKPVMAKQLHQALCSLVDEEEVLQPESSREPQVAVRSERTQILVAEDNPVNQEVTSALLGLLGYDPCIVENGKAAVEAWQHGDYKIILMDCQMPVLDGYSATREIRASGEKGIKVPVIALTAHAMQGEYDRARAAGMNDVVTKPLQLEELKAALEKWL